MKKIAIYEPAMCCPTGLCGVGIDPELLRISALIDTLKKNGVDVQRFNLTSSPQEFINNKAVNEFLNSNGVEGLPITLFGEEIMFSGRYPTDEEIANLVNLPMKRPKSPKITAKRSGGCCSGGDCC